jgi:hypothetical protein
MRTRRFTGLTNAFSKNVENYAHSVALFAMYYNFVRVHETLRATPIMAANVTKRLWEMSEDGLTGDSPRHSKEPTTKQCDSKPSVPGI